MQDRENTLKVWLGTVFNTTAFEMAPLAGDASFRRYFRIKINGISYVAMDAPPEKEAIEPFIRINRMLSQASVLVPELVAINEAQGFLLLNDFGDDVLLQHLNENTADNYYTLAIDTIDVMQNGIKDTATLPEFDRAHMLNEMRVCPEWFLKGYLGLEITHAEHDVLESSMNWIANEVYKQPQVFIHRDYHSRNLMLVGDRLGVIDFQDAMRGPFTYDLVSLLKDCYISWPRQRVLNWLRYFHANNAHASSMSYETLVRAFDLCGIQRHLKVLGVFSRLYLRDHKPGYLKDLPLTLNYVNDVAEIYEELVPLQRLMQKRVRLR